MKNLRRREVAAMKMIAKALVGEAEYVALTSGGGMDCFDIIAVAGRRGGVAKSPRFYLDAIRAGREIKIGADVVIPEKKGCL